MHSLPIAPTLFDLLAVARRRPSWRATAGVHNNHNVAAASPWVQTSQPLVSLVPCTHSPAPICPSSTRAVPRQIAPVLHDGSDQAPRRISFTTGNAALRARTTSATPARAAFHILSHAASPAERPLPCFILPLWICHLAGPSAATVSSDPRPSWARITGRSPTSTPTDDAVLQLS